MKTRFNVQDWLDSLEDFKGFETINDEGDEFVNQVYIQYDRFRCELLDELLESAGFKFPFEEVISIYEFEEILDLLAEWEVDTDILIENAKIANKEKLESVEEILNAEIEFPNKEMISILLEEILDEYGVPDGTGYEFDGNVPQELEYWSNQINDDDYEYQSLKLINTDIQQYEVKIDAIRDKVITEDDDLTKKSLLLSAFVITESFIKAKIVSRLPDTDTVVSDNFYKEILEKHISKELRETAGRERLFNKVFETENIKMLAIPNLGLRNSLAHDIEAPTIKGEDINYFHDREKVNKKVSITELFDELIAYPENLDKNFKKK